MTTNSPHITKSSQVLVCIVCSSDSRVWDAFDPVTKKWMRLPEIPTDQDIFNHSDKKSLAVGSELLVFGREQFGFATWKYSLVEQNWRKCDGMHRPRCLFGSGTLGSIAIVAGGSDQNGNILKSAELYDSSRGSWERLPNMHSPRTLCTGFFIHGKFYVIGGGSSNDSSTYGEEFDIKTKKWRKIDDVCPNVTMAADGHPLVTVVSNELYGVEKLSNMIMKYNKRNYSWEVLGRLPVRADLFHGCGIAFKACGEGLLVVGGERRPLGEAIVLNYWSPKSGVKDGGILDWKVIGVKEHAGAFVYDCAVMGS
ncbi:hypothetical protein L2E82_25099 [Cichorium intybus]|uniref:Uncharacterized protein n=1 Tax=Cichorium intybus TaxID=13427 RepID=A0ACB9E2Y9_CICIN|nr:hypothetical protein L2E82_25099 [Cichorium intybus]